MKQKQTNWLVFHTALGIFCAFFLFPSLATAQVTSVFVTNMPSISGSAAQAAQVIEERYHLNLESIRNQGENFNVSSQKGHAPQVLLYFSPSDPKPGVEMEARAFPQYFGNSTETLYFTWYIRRKGCGLDDSPGEEKRTLCDRNADRKITVEDWKIEAMQVVASRSFDSTCALNGSLSDEERRECARDMYNRDARSRINPSGSKGRDRDEDGYRATFGGDAKSGQKSYCYIHDFQDGYNYELPACVHFFPDNYEIDGSGNIRRAGDVADGDDSFPIEQEHFWRTDPEDPSTAQNGNKDEANLAGLGQDTFRWTYAPEDLVGVIVEGFSMYNTKYDNASMMIMWALPKNKCPIDPVFKSSKTESIKGYDVPIKTIASSNNGRVFDINDCLDDNLVDPTEGGQSENLDLSLAYTPQEPSAKLIPWSESGASAEEIAQTGDVVHIRAASSNARRGASYTNYAWRVQASKDGTFNTRFNEENVWVDITEDLEAAKNISSVRGNNVTTLSINLNLNDTLFTDPKTNSVIPGFGQYFEDDIAYFRVSVNAVENFNGKTSQSGVSSVVVKVVANKSIDVYGVDSVLDGATGLVSVKRDSNTFCRGNTFQQTICPVLNHQIVGVRLDTSGEDIRDYSWTINGQALVCTEAVSSECAGEKQGATNFFPVSGKVGDIYTLSVAASNADTGRSFTVSRRFQIVEPDFDIISTDTESAWSKHLGDYVNLDGSTSSDMSKTSFEGIPGSTAQFSAEFRPEILGPFILDGIKAGDDQNEMIWSINGRPFKWNDQQLSLSLDGASGAMYTVSLSGAYNQPRELRKALYDIWKISPFNSETVRFSKEVQIRLVNGNDYLGKGQSNTFFASLISSVPPFVIFSVRLIVSLGLILLISGVAFSFMPEKELDAFAQR